MDQSAGIWSQCLEVASLTDVGLRRANNQDAFMVSLAGSQADFEQRGHLFMVADGMGAHAAGELASKIATDVISLDYRKLLDQRPPEAILAAVLNANRQIHGRGQASPDFRGMGTTATILLLLPVGALVAHVGDSRVYRLRGSRIEQLTFDHSLVWELQASGQLPDGEVPAYVSKNIITRSLGPNATVKVDLEGPHPVQAGDTFLVCCDGLSNPVKDDEIALVLQCLPPREAVQALIDLACLRGGPDNITAIIVRVLGPQAAESSDPGLSSATTPSVARPVHPLLWTALGVVSLAALGLLMLGRPILALGGLAAAAALLTVALRLRYGGADHAGPDHRRFGRGPYASADGSPNPELLGRLADIVRQLREAAIAGKWPLDWKDFDGLLAGADQAAAAGDLLGAARGQLRAISSLMAQLRAKRDIGSDSGVFL